MPETTPNTGGTPVPPNPFDALQTETEHVWFAISGQKLDVLRAQMTSIPNDKAVAILQAADKATEAGMQPLQILKGIVEAALGAAKLVK